MKVGSAITKMLLMESPIPTVGVDWHGMWGAIYEWGELWTLREWGEPEREVNKKKEIFSLLWFKWCLRRRHCDSLSRSLLQSFTTSRSSPHYLAKTLALNISSDHSTQRGFSHFIGRPREVVRPMLSFKCKLLWLGPYSLFSPLEFWNEFKGSLNLEKYNEK